MFDPQFDKRKVMKGRHLNEILPQDTDDNIGVIGIVFPVDHAHDYLKFSAEVKRFGGEIVDYNLQSDVAGMGFAIIEIDRVNQVDKFIAALKTANLNMNIQALTQRSVGERFYLKYKAHKNPHPHADAIRAVEFFQQKKMRPASLRTLRQEFLKELKRHGEVWLRLESVQTHVSRPDLIAAITGVSSTGIFLMASVGKVELLGAPVNFTRCAADISFLSGRKNILYAEDSSSDENAVSDTGVLVRIKNRQTFNLLLKNKTVAEIKVVEQKLRPIYQDNLARGRDIFSMRRLARHTNPIPPVGRGLGLARFASTQKVAQTLQIQYP